jgi:hypothetical protein
MVATLTVFFLVCLVPLLVGVLVAHFVVFWETGPITVVQVLLTLLVFVLLRTWDIYWENRARAKRLAAIAASSLADDVKLVSTLNTL